MPRRTVIAVIGSGRDVEPAVSNAQEVGRLIAKNRWVLLSGGRDAGVMRAANRGAKEVEGNLTVGILPNREAAVSPDVDVAIVTDTGHSRNNIIVLSADVVIACGVDGAGTASEVALALKNRKPVVLLGSSEQAIGFFSTIGTDLLHNAESPSQAIDVVQGILSERR